MPPANEGGSDHEAAGKRPRPAASWATALLAIVLTLLVWVLFWQARMPLDAGSTAVVALAVVIVVLGGQFLWGRLRP